MIFTKKCRGFFAYKNTAHEMPAWWPTVEKVNLSTSIYNAKSCGVPVMKSTNFQRLIHTLHIHLRSPSNFKISNWCFTLYQQYFGRWTDWLTDWLDRVLRRIGNISAMIRTQLQTRNWKSSKDNKRRITQA